MSTSIQYVQQNTSDESKEDCRDYLRTGRCKYGASCKYRHPPNVQSGGGMKGPINPSEPMFPIRPNEPVCQYYMKHGTCKFGQACKFHHPPSSPMHLASNNPRFRPVVVPKNGNDEYDSAAVLPQRPEEPNCIYFLKNGRCKYGVTCRYHHPLNYHNRRPPGNDGRRHHLSGPSESGVVQPKLQYVSLPPGTYQQGQFVVADGQLAFLSLDGSTQGQVISVAPPSVNQEVPMVFTTTANSKPHSTLSRDVGSTTSCTSIASSFESSIVGSGGSLNAFSVQDQQGGRAAHGVHSGRPVMPQISNDGGGVNSLPQVVSTTYSLDGNGSNAPAYNHAYFDVRRPTQSPILTESGGSTATYRGQRSSSFDHTRPTRTRLQGGIRESASVPSLHYEEQRGGVVPSAASAGQVSHQFQPQQRGPPPMMRRPPPTTTGAWARGKRQNNRGVDDGLSMMTSALLTMLDTPEEVAGEQYQDFDEYPPPSESTTPVIGNLFPARENPLHSQIANNSNGNYNINARIYVPQATKPQYYEQEQDRSNMMPGYQYDGEDEGYGIPRGQSMERVQRWSPSMRGSDQQPGDSMVHQAMPNDLLQRLPNSAYESTNVGQYFP